jgi:hypothetical protein
VATGAAKIINRRIDVIVDNTNNRFFMPLLPLIRLEDDTTKGAIWNSMARSDAGEIGRDRRRVAGLITTSTAIVPGVS